MAEKKRPKAESFFQTKALDMNTRDDEMARPKKPDQAIKVLVEWPVHEDPEGLPWDSVCSLVKLYLSEPGRHWLLGGRAGICRQTGH